MARQSGTTIAAILLQIVLLAVFSSLGPHRAAAATFEPIAPGVISIQGRIELGDCDKWKEAVGRNVKTVLLNSPGGRVGQGECISRSIAHLHVRTVVLQKCASICFLMFAAGAERHACEGARIGVHRPAPAGTHEEEADPNALNGILHYAGNYGVPDAIKIKLSSTPAEDIYWLSADDLGAMEVQSCT